MKKNFFIEYPIVLMLPFLIFGGFWYMSFWDNLGSSNDLIGEIAVFTLGIYIINLLITTIHRIRHAEDPGRRWAALLPYAVIVIGFFVFQYYASKATGWFAGFDELYIYIKAVIAGIIIYPILDLILTVRINNKNY